MREESVIAKTSIHKQLLKAVSAGNFKAAESRRAVDKKAMKGSSALSVEDEHGHAALGRDSRRRLTVGDDRVNAL